MTAPAQAAPPLLPWQGPTTGSQPEPSHKPTPASAPGGSASGGVESGMLAASPASMLASDPLVIGSFASDLPASLAASRSGSAASSGTAAAPTTSWPGVTNDPWIVGTGAQVALSVPLLTQVESAVHSVPMQAPRNQ